MAITQFHDYERVQGYQDFEDLPRGGYVLRILEALIGHNSSGEYIQLKVDVAEGDYSGFFAKDYENQGAEKKWHFHYFLNVPKDDGTEQDGWTKRKFKTFTDALEESNSGYHFDWDEQKFVGMLVGGLVNKKEFEKNSGGTGWSANIAQICSVQKIREGNFKLPEDKGLSNSKSSNDFLNIPSGSVPLPFS